MKPVAIIGYDRLPVGNVPDATVLDLFKKVFYGAVRNAGISTKQIDGLVITPEGFGPPNALMLAPRLADWFQLSLRSLNRVECGGCSSLTAIRNAVTEILLGRCDVCCVLAAEVADPAEPPLDNIEGYMYYILHSVISIYGPYFAPVGLGTATPLYALATQRYMHEYGISEADIARYAVVMRKHAGNNPYALYREPITVEDVLASRVVSPPIHLFECSRFMTGAACTILASEEAAKKLGVEPVFITGFGESHDPSHFVPHEPGGSITNFKSVTRAADEALNDASISRDQLDVIEIYDVFAAPGLMLLEDLGFFKKGEAPEAVKKGLIDLDGQVPTNPSGGRICMGHPAGVTPQLMLIELAEQLKGVAGARQVKNARRALVQAEHGMLNGALIFILSA